MPPVGIFDAPNTAVSINLQWLAHVRGALNRLRDLDYWQPEDAPDALHEIEKLFAALGQDTPMSSVPIGSIVAVATEAEPEAGWLRCDGSFLQIADYPALYAVIGLAWGGNEDIFGIPNMSTKTTFGVGGGHPFTDEKSISTEVDGIHENLTAIFLHYWIKAE